MFTGLVQATGRLEHKERLSSGERLWFSHPWDALELGESIAVNGACLTMVIDEVRGTERAFAADVSIETLALTTLGELTLGSKVNFERALSASDKLGGHLVTGHVDGVATIVSRRELGQMIEFELGVPRELGRYIAKKGSLAVHGVSLTVNTLQDEAELSRVGLLIIPHTLEATNLGELEIGSRVNFEVDLVARYVERWSTSFRS